jgi:hypothetical protein
MVEQRSHQLGRLLDSTEGPDGKSFYLLEAFDAAFDPIPFDVRPDRLVAIEMRLVTGSVPYKEGKAIPA